MSDWYYAANDEQKGPINESELKENFAGNKLPIDTLVWKEGMDNWVPANQVPAFSFRPPPAPAKVQPGAATASTEEAPAAAGSSTTPVSLASLVGPGEALEVDYDDAEKNKIFGILAYLWLLCLVPIFAAKDSPFAKYHANQGLVLFLVEVVLWIALTILSGVAWAAFPSSIMSFFALLQLIYLGPLVLLVIGIINAAQGKCVPLPVIGGIKILK